MVAKNGRCFPVSIRADAIKDENGDVIGLIGVHTDITERKQAEESLRFERKQLLSIFDSIDEVIYVSDPDTYEDLCANKTLKDALQKSPIGGICYREFQGLDAPCHFCTNDIIRKRKYVPYSWEYHNPVLNRDYTIIDRIIKWPDGRDVRFELAINITERKRIEVELENHRKHLEDLVKRRTESLEAKNKELEIFSYSVSHDLKAPLRGIDGYSRLLMEDYADKLEGEGLLFLNNIRRSAEQMNQLIEDLLAYSRAERRQLQVVSFALRPIIEMLISQKSHDIEVGNIRISVSLPFEMITSDPETLRQVLDNYLDNAIKFMKKDGSGAVEVGGRENQESWTRWVKDNGIGFDRKYHDRIFDVFQRLHRTEDYPGTGVGLALVRKAVERIDGRVWAESEVGSRCPSSYYWI